MFKRLADFANYVIGDTYSEANEGLKGRVVGRRRRASAARSRSPRSWTSWWPTSCARSCGRSRLTATTRVGRCAERCGPISGRCSAGRTPAPTSTGCAARPYTTRFLGDMIRGRKLVPLERAVQMITDEPARLFGLRDRGRLAEGQHADIVVFDPDAIGSEHADARERSARRRGPAHRRGQRRRAGVGERRRDRRPTARPPAPCPAPCCAAPGTPRRSPRADPGNRAAAGSDQCGVESQLERHEFVRTGHQPG